jgi:hypothetical protein
MEGREEERNEGWKGRGRTKGREGGVRRRVVRISLFAK